MKKTLLICLMALMTITTFAQEASVRVFAHRGGMAEFDENTLTAFNGAYKAGFRGFETDIRMTKDGEFVLLHDSNLPNGKGNVETSKAKDIKNLKIGKSKVLFLEDLLDWIEKKGDIQYFEFELKTDPSLYSQEMVEQMCEAIYHKIMATKPVGSTFVISSADPRPLSYLKGRFSESNLMLITSEPVNTATITMATEMGLKRLAGKLDGTSLDAVKKAHKEGLFITLWPSDEIEEVALGISLGADAVCTDIPVAAKKALNKAMPWVTIAF